MNAAQKSESPAATGLSANQTNPNANSKRYHTLRARAALAGVQLYEIDDDHGKTVYIVSRWALTLQLDCLDDAEKWLDRVAPVRLAVNHE